MEKLSIEYGVAAYVQEFFNRYLFAHKKEIFEYYKSNAETSHLNEFARIVRVYIEDNLKNVYKEYILAVIVTLSGVIESERDQETADRIIMEAMKNNHLVDWYRSTL